MEEGKKILVVDDEAFIRVLLMQTLEDLEDEGVDVPGLDERPGLRDVLSEDVAERRVEKMRGGVVPRRGEPLLAVDLELYRPGVAQGSLCVLAGVAGRGPPPGDGAPAPRDPAVVGAQASAAAAYIETVPGLGYGLIVSAPPD